MIEAGVHQPGAITYGYSLPPNTPKERVQILRRAFIQAVKDPDLLNDANKANLEIAPASGEEIDRVSKICSRRRRGGGEAKRNFEMTAEN